jgi:hypothetical protein
VVPTGGRFFLLTLLCASLLPARQMDAECFKDEIDGGVVAVVVDGVKVAATVWSALIATLHAPVPLHAPPHPTNVVPAAGVAVNASVVEAPKLAEQVPGHAIAVPLTVPAPLPATDTVKV